MFSALYVHIPFTRTSPLHDGYAVPYDEALADRYLDALTQDITYHASRNTFPVIYIGGGQPASLSATQLAKLCSLIQPLGSSIQHREATIELDPRNIDEEKLSMLKEAAFHRIVLCAADEGDVALLPECIAAAHDQGLEHIAIDAPIACEPQIATLNVQHISLLEGAAELSEDEFLSRMQEAEQHLVGEGYERYELWSYARPGSESAYTRHVWGGGDYIGVGAGAVSTQGLRHATQVSDCRAYIDALASGNRCPQEEDARTLEERAIEMASFGLSLCDGVDLQAIQDVLIARLPNLGRKENRISKAWKKIVPVFQALEKQRLVVGQGDRWRLTPDGRFKADYVMRELLT